jgi:hypothetical protein
MSLLGVGSVGNRERGLNNDEDLLISPDASEPRAGRYFKSDNFCHAVVIFFVFRSYKMSLHAMFVDLLTSTTNTYNMKMTWFTSR